jgi:colanic acid/amylovoran biosynthesis glycosyltransferase
LPPPERAVVMPVGFDLTDYPAESTRTYRINGVLRLNSIGRLSEEKGLVYAIDAVSQLVTESFTQILYTIVGRGLQDNYFREYVNNNLQKYVEFAGEKDKSGVVNLLKATDVLILPSLITDTWAETQTTVVQEAMFMRLLVIGTTAGRGT